MSTPINTGRLKAALDSIHGPVAGDDSDFRIATAVGDAFLARGRGGEPTLLIPLEAAPVTAGRRGGGFALNSADRVLFRTEDREWEQAAATLACTESGLVDTFLVLVADIARRLEAAQKVDWPAVLTWVEEWQILLARRPVMDLDRQLGLWGELWVIASASHPDVLIAGWRGPDREAMDFFLDGISLEVKVSRRPHVHHVSQRQVDRPVGSHGSFVLSIWAGIDPVRGRSLGELIDDLMGRVADAGFLLSHVANLGYAPVDRAEYSTKFVPLEEPRWFRTEDVPRVREIDQGISEIRYVVTLDVARALEEQSVRDMWIHFCGKEPIL